MPRKNPRAADPLRDLVPKSPSPDQWTRVGNRWVMPELQSEFLDWLLTLESDREHATEAEWAAAHDRSISTVRSWKANDRFRLEWSKRGAAKNLGPDRMQTMLDMLFEKAILDKDVQAARDWLKEVSRYMPPVKVEQDEDTMALSDAELDSELRELLDERGEPSE